MQADITKVVEIVFGAVDRDTKSTIDSISTSLSTLDAGIQGIADPVAGFTEGLLKAETGVAALAAAFIAASTNEASQFGEKIEEIGSLVNATPEQVSALGNSIQQFAVDSTSDFEKINQAIYIATSNLGDTSKAMDILSVAEKGAVVGATDLESSTALLTRTMNAYGLVTDDSAANTANAERVMAAMFTTVQNGDVNMTSLSDNMGKIASSAAAANIPIETVGAAIAAITGAGVNAEQSMTLLNALFKELLSPSDELSKALGGLKVTSDGLPAVMEALKNSTGGSADKIYELFSSSEAAKGALILANDSAGKFHTTLGAMKDGVANLNQNFNDFAGGMADSLQKLENSWTSMMITVGNPNRENFQAVYDAFAQVLQAIEASMRVGAFDEIYKQIDSFSDNLSTSLATIAKNLPEAFSGVDFSGFSQALGGLGDELGRAFADIFGNVDLNTIEGLRSAIQTTVNIISALVKTTTSIIEQFSPIFKAIGEAGKQVGGASDESANAAGKLLGALTILGEFGTVLGGVIVVLKGAEADISNVFNTLAGGGKVFTNGLQMAFDGLALAIVGTLEGAAFAIAKFLDGIGADDTARKFYDASGELKLTADGIKANLAANAQDMKEAWSQMTDGLTGSSAKAAEGVVQIGVAAEKPKENIASLGQSSKTLADVFAEVGQRIDPLTGEILSLENASGRTNEEIKKLVDTANGLGAATDKASEGFQTLAEAEQYLADNAKEGQARFIEYKDGLYKLTDGGFSAADAQDKLGDATKTAAKKAGEGTPEWERVQKVMLDTQKQTNDFQLKLGELAAKKYEIDVKAAVDLQVAQIVADTQRIQASFEATSQAITDLTKGSTDLWSSFSDAKSTSSKWALEDAAMRMEKRLDDELELKRQMTAAQIDLIGIKRDALLRNGGQIIINADTLAPELQLVMRSLVEHIQIQANADGLEMLL